MQNLLSIIATALVTMAIVVFAVSAFFSAKHLVGMATPKEFTDKCWRLTLIGAGTLLLATLLQLGFDLWLGNKIWTGSLLVNILDLCLCALLLHTLFHRWKLQWPAWLSIMIIFADANLRFIISFFQSFRG